MERTGLSDFTSAKYAVRTPSEPKAPRVPGSGSLCRVPKRTVFGCCTKLSKAHCASCPHNKKTVMGQGAPRQMFPPRSKNLVPRGYTSLFIAIAAAARNHFLRGQPGTAKIACVWSALHFATTSGSREYGGFIHRTPEDQDVWNASSTSRLPGPHQRTHRRLDLEAKTSTSGWTLKREIISKIYFSRTA